MREISRKLFLMFQQGDQIAYWYLLLSGEVQLFIPATKGRGGRVIETLNSVALFGELSVQRHTCSARVTRNSEFVTINHAHFIALYNKHADHLQPHLIIMQDLISDDVGFRPPTVPPHRQHHVRHNAFAADVEEYEPPEDDVVYDFADMRQRCAELVLQSLESRTIEAGLLLKQTMQIRAAGLIRDRKGNMQIYRWCMVGTEMVDWLCSLANETLNSTTTPLTRFQVVGMWQALLDNGIISHVNSELQFADKHVFYRWTIDDGNDELVMRARNDHLSELENPLPPLLPAPHLSDVASAVFFLSTIGPDALFRMILSKPSSERTAEELELVYEELLHVKALAHLSTMVKRELASVVFFEQHQHAGTVLFRQGDEGNCWYIILKGSVNVSIHGKGVVCTLQEGDDFGKLALVNDAPRAATIALSEDNSQFLRVDKTDFNRILRDVEANTVRLKEHGHDVLVLEKINTTYNRDATTDPYTGEPLTPRQNCCYSVMAGLPEKMVEYLLETRIDAHAEDSYVDTFLEDFVLTHTIYMPPNILCNYLKNYYMRGSTVRPDNGRPLDDVELRIGAKKRVVVFLGLWVHTLGIHFFLDPVSNSFVEELYCCVLEDSRQLCGMLPILERMSAIRQLRENAMRTLNRHPSVVLDCGVYCAHAPAPNPVLPFDTCNQVICLSDTSLFTMSIRLDKTAAEICDLAKVKVRYGGSNEEFKLVEVKSNGERVVFSPTDVSIPTMISLNGRLYIAYADEIETLVALFYRKIIRPQKISFQTPLLQQDGPVESVHASMLELLSSVDIAQQLSIFHTQLFEATDEIELITQVFGRDQFPGRIPSNLDLLMRRFNEVQFWTTTEVLLAHGPSKRVTMLKKFIKIASHAKENRDLMSLFAIILGLSNVAVSRITHIWDKLPSKMRRQYAEFEALLDPSRNHRAYRMLVAKMSSPTVPFVPLLLKDLTFTHEGNKTYFAGLVNFEKMHMIANVLRSFKQCKSKYPVTSFDHKKVFESKNLIRNFKVIDNQRRLMEISFQIEPSKRKRAE
ncbi:unnamed protein product [Toxocara canis]|uniref:Rap guanine nucleotide exchange factor 4 n=1 Tax=Toxocara canis TaxID=6265 RepID=A0A183UIT1_TOXCA|nr:unnamed protein product [Toxocara canis]